MNTSTGPQPSPDTDGGVSGQYSISAEVKGFPKYGFRKSMPIGDLGITTPSRVVRESFDLEPNAPVGPSHRLEVRAH